MSTKLNSLPPECLVLSANEAAKLLKISVRHFWACCASGRLGPQPIKLGRSKRWRLDELHAWVMAGGPPRDEWEARSKPKMPSQDASASGGEGG